MAIAPPAIWSTHWAAQRSALQAAGFTEPLPPGSDVAMDERLVELPRVHASGARGRLLADLHIVTLEL